LLDKGEAFLKRRFRARHIARRQPGFGKLRHPIWLPDWRLAAIAV
jgi:hypothetical protein